MKSTHLIATILAAVLATGTVYAQEPQAPKPATKIVVYDISDLLLRPEKYPYDSGIQLVTEVGKPLSIGIGGYGGYGQGGGGGFGGGGIPQPGPGSPTGKAAVEEEEVEDLEMFRVGLRSEISQIIRSSVDADNWEDSGGVGSTREFSGKLIITQTPENHKAIEAVLAQLRGDGPAQLTVRARWVRLTREQVKELLEKGSAWKLKDGFGDFIAKNPDSVAFEGQTTAFSGQRVHVASGRGKTVVVDTQPVTATGATASDPDVRQVFIGAMLEATATQTADGKAVLDVRSVVSEDFSLQPGERNPGGKSVTADLKPVVGEELVFPRTWPNADDQHEKVDRMDYAVQNFKTTMRVPLGAPVLVGGMTQTRLDASTPLYLVVEVLPEK